MTIARKKTNKRPVNTYRPLLVVIKTEDKQISLKADLLI